MTTKRPLNVVLIEPEIPSNTGNIGRTCVGLNAHLHLVGDMGFTLTDRRLKRAGLDYWPHLTFTHYENVESWKIKVSDPARVFYFTTKSQNSFYQTAFEAGDWLVFGKETKGLNPEIWMETPGQALTIPMTGPIRSLNLATSVAIVLFEASRQQSLDTPQVKGLL